MLVGPSKPARRYAFLLAAAYFAVSCFYLLYSNSLVHQISHGSLERFEELQRIKGCCFMLVTAIAFYFSIRWVSKKAARSAQELHETQERWMDAERQAAPALLASVIAHDVANLLTILRLNVEKIKRVPCLPEPANEAIVKFDQATDRLTELVKRLRGASSSLFNEPPMEFDFAESVKETLELLQGHVCCENATIELAGVTGVQLRGYPVLVHQLVMNLMINAAEATSRRGRIRFTVTEIEGGVGLVVDDDGPGIEPSLRERVQSAFFTTKSTGSGIGLTSVRSCVEIHKGSMQISDSPDLGGARFVIALPDLTDSRLDDLRHPDRRLRALAPDLSH